jgi:hypothetical protein
MQSGPKHAQLTPKNAELAQDGRHNGPKLNPTASKTKTSWDIRKLGKQRKSESPRSPRKEPVLIPKIAELAPQWVVFD